LSKQIIKFKNVENNEVFLVQSYTRGGGGGALLPSQIGASVQAKQTIIKMVKTREYAADNSHQE
jgi:hypothetical protein